MTGIRLCGKNVDRPRQAPTIGVRQYDRLLRFMGARLANERDAEELAQEAYVRLLRASKSRLNNDPVAYLFRIARNLLHEWYASRPPQSDSLEEHELRDTGLSVEDQTEVSQYMDRLESALNQLAPKCRAAILMHRRDGMTYDEIAADLGVSSSMVKKYLSQGLARCRASLRGLRES